MLGVLNADSGGYLLINNAGVECRACSGLMLCVATIELSAPALTTQRAFVTTRIGVADGRERVVLVADEEELSHVRVGRWSSAEYAASPPRPFQFRRTHRGPSGPS